MFIRKGPYGHFICESLEQNQEPWNYSTEIINSFSDVLLPVYMAPSITTINLSFRKSIDIMFDYSGLISINDYINQRDKKGIDKITVAARRKCLRDLFMFIATCSDYLLFPINISLDANTIFTSTDGKSAKICMLPIKQASECLDLHLIDTKKLEQILKHDFFREVLSIDEINQILYSIKNNDSNSLSEVISESNNQVRRDFKELIKHYSLPIYLLVFALIMLAFNMPLLSLASFITSVTSLIIQLTKRKQNLAPQTTSSTRKDILFDSNAAWENKENKQFNYLTIKSKQMINDSYIERTVYTESATIGSDQFLSDIVINDLSVDYCHAEICKNNNSFYLKALSSNKITCLESRQIKKDTKYEIKNGQVIKLGDIEFEISIR